MGVLRKRQSRVEGCEAQGGFQRRVKDSAGPCDCIKDSDGSRPEKKTQIDLTPSANPDSLCVLERVDASRCK
jgi:hypothetical protein